MEAMSRRLACAHPDSAAAAQGHCSRVVGQREARGLRLARPVQQVASVDRRSTQQPRLRQARSRARPPRAWRKRRRRAISAHAALRTSGATAQLQVAVEGAERYYYKLLQFTNRF